MLRDNGIIILFDFLLSEKNNGETKPFGNRGYSALYTIGFTLGGQAFRPDESAVLYTNIRAEIERYLTDSVVAPLLDASLVGLPMIQKFSKAWGDAKTMTRWIAMLFHHVDTGYVSNSNSATLSGLGMSLFRKIGFFQTCDRVRSGVLDLIDQERYGAAVDEAEIRNCVEVFKVMGSCSPEACHELKDVPTLLKQTIDLSIYHEHFEASFLARTTAFYKAKAESWREEPVSNYLKLVERALASEKARADRYLHASTERPLRLATVAVLLSEPQQELVNRPASGMRTMLECDREDDLKRMYAASAKLTASASHARCLPRTCTFTLPYLFSGPFGNVLRRYMLFTQEGVAGQEGPLIEVFENFVLAEGMKIIDSRRVEVAAIEANGKKESAADGHKTVVDLLALHAKAQGMLMGLFRRNHNFSKAIASSFFNFVNADASEKVSNVELLVAYLDGVLKGKEGTLKLDERAVEERLDGAMRLFQYVNRLSILGQDTFAWSMRPHLLTCSLLVAPD